MAETALILEQKPDWRDKQLRKKHAKLLAVRRENEGREGEAGGGGISHSTGDGAVAVAVEVVAVDR